MRTLPVAQRTRALVILEGHNSAPSWAEPQRRRMRPTLWRVASKANPADAPSRGDCTQLPSHFVPQRVDFPSELLRPGTMEALAEKVWGEGATREAP